MTAALPSPAKGAPSAAPEASLASAAADCIRELDAQLPAALACDVGRVVLMVLYDGDEAAYRGHGRKRVSLRALAAALDGHRSLDARRLSLCVRVFTALRRSGIGAASLEHLGMGHLRAALRAPRQGFGALVLRADRERWSVRRLESHVRGRCGAASAAGARREVADARRLLAIAEQVCALVTDDARFGGARCLGALSPQQERRLRLASTIVIDRFEELRRRIAARPPTGVAGRRSAVPDSISSNGRESPPASENRAVYPSRTAMTSVESAAREAATTSASSVPAAARAARRGPSPFGRVNSERR